MHLGIEVPEYQRHDAVQLRCIVAQCTAVQRAYAEAQRAAAGTIATMHWLSPGMRCGRPHLPFVFFPSYTLRHRSWVVHGKSGSGPDLRFPKNYLVWGKLKIDSRPYKPSPNLHPKSDLVKSVLQQNYTFRNNTTGGPTQARKLAGQGKRATPVVVE